MSKIQQSLKFVKEIGGVKGAFWRFMRENTARIGVFVGEDKYGNKYYENNKYLFGRNRFVEYPYAGRMEYHATQVPPEWHRWLHNMTDDPPSKVPPVPRKFFLDHETSKTGTDEKYVPYSTTRPKIESWTPPKAK
ncbi:predicted protein [Nematostella vectensis]|uniref:NADH dehydrogenase [ubiquinone] 1 alpha subcomplex subunit 12 n=1 Tax=Nematostella vectensis TaxID=45351 RepID=A7RT53_NEMVE|nr:probable NADH dehydrogenase [ubiquinone] 1 alpha subcomplex subunit 12 [Nematostella vectensis]EDO45329.1 predicted protein [Nematostella vectensis]|eukprot:XP_001637392.1 predicted protein [Nematostella vectensis]